MKREVISQGIVAQISGTTIWRWLSEDALHPWTRRSWVFPRDPQFNVKAGRVLDLYHGMWQGELLGSEDFVLCADEKTQLQIRERRHAIVPPAPGFPMLVEHEYRRRGTCAYQVAWDVHRATLFGHVVPRSTIEHFDQLVAQVMTSTPYKSANRVFWIVDNGTIHRGQRAINRLQNRWSNLVLVHLPVHASWLNQVEIYLSILQRKALTPDDFSTFGQIADRILGFQAHYQEIARPFDWKFTRQDLARILGIVKDCCEPLAHAA